MAYGDRILERGAQGADVQELQIRLAGFRGTVPDGKFGPGTELQVIEFQRRFMDVRRPTGVADGETLRAIDDFAGAFPLSFSDLRCPCGTCGGFGQGRFKGRYVLGQPKIEPFYRYEYPGIHRMILWAVRTAFFLIPEFTFKITSGYRCAVRNEQTGRTTTNHFGKAVDFDILPGVADDKQADMLRCDSVRGRLVEWSNAQIGWGAVNRKALEPSSIAPTWVHYDVRCYERQYLEERFFCTSLSELDQRLPVNV